MDQVLISCVIRNAEGFYYRDGAWVAGPGSAGVCTFPHGEQLTQELRAKGEACETLYVVQDRRFYYFSPRGWRADLDEVCLFSKEEAARIRRG